MSGQEKKALLEGQYCFLFFFRRFGSFFSVDSIIRLLFFFLCWFNHSPSLLFLCQVNHSTSLLFLLIQSSNERSVLYLCFCCVDTNSIEREGKKQCKCQKLVKTFRIKKVPIKRNVFNDVMGWLSSVCNNMLYLTTQVVKRECHL